MNPLHHLAESEIPRAAAFDADGVLWRGDVSEDFTRWMIDRGHFDAGLWPDYIADNTRDRGHGCLSMLRFYRGLDLPDLDKLVADFWQHGGDRQWIGLITRTIRWLSDAGVSVFVVSGTPRPLLEPLQEHLPIPPAQILGLELEVDEHHRATGRHRGTPTFGPGKAEALRDATDLPVHLAVGNSVIDIEMLGLSTDLCWAVEPDEPLRARAMQAGWTILDAADLTI